MDRDVRVPSCGASSSGDCGTSVASVPVEVGSTVRTLPHGHRCFIETLYITSALDGRLLNLSCTRVVHGERAERDSIHDPLFHSDFVGVGQSNNKPTTIPK